MPGSALRVLLLTSSLALLQCLPERVAGGAGAGNPPSPPAEVALSVVAVSKPEARAKRAAPGTASAAPGTGDGLAAADSAGSLIFLDSIRLSAGRIGIELPSNRSCEDAPSFDCADHEISLKGPFAMDLVSGKSLPALALMKLPEGVYRHVELEPLPRPGDSGSSAPGPAGNFAVRGRVIPAGRASMEFRLELDLEDGIDFIDSAGIIAEGDSLSRMLLALRVDVWFEGVDLAACLESGEARRDSAGVLGIGGDLACGGMGRRMGENIDRSGELEEKAEDD